MLYRSRSTRGSDIAVSGWVVVPTGTPPAGGWPIVAWNHPTKGMAACSADALTDRFDLPVPGATSSRLHGRRLRLRRTRHAGSLALPRGRELRAHRARRNPSRTQARAERIEASAQLSHGSEGGLASTATAELWPYYALEIDLRLRSRHLPRRRTVTCRSPGRASLRRDLFRPRFQAVAGANNAYPAASFPSYYLTASGISKLTAVQGTPCMPAPAATDDLQPWVLSNPVTPPAPSAAMIDAEARGWITTRATATPVLLAHGLSDTLVPPALPTALVPELCAIGSEVELRWYAANHFNLPGVAQTDVLAWIDNRLADGPYTTNQC